MDRESVPDVYSGEAQRLRERSIDAGRKLGVAGNGDVVFAQMALKSLDSVDAPEM
jgi:hypothetical protein